MKPFFIIAEKNGIDLLTQFVIIDPNGNEELIYIPGMYLSENLGFSWPLLAWIETIPDIRWDHRNYTVVKCMNLESRKVYFLSRRSRYRYPAVSPDASEIAVVDYTSANHFAITILNSRSGEIKSSFPAPGNLMPLNPCCIPDGRHLYAIVVSDKGKNIQCLDVLTGDWKLIYNPGYREMYQLHADKNRIYFRSGYSGIENIYALNKQSLKVYQVTSSRFGAFDPCPANGKLYYTDHSSEGYNLVCADLQYSRLDT